ncbi:MAG: hypothetical protein LVQ95_02790 [Candidatus Micrarchaeales archaeon]|nr:hypothetical protein [Candidatus Micrarchaeales archaeon]
MGIFNIFGKKDVASDLAKPAPFRISTEWIPYRLYARKKSSAMLVIRLKNATQEVLLTSVVAELPKNLGFDTINVAKEREARLGDVAPGEEKELRFEVFSGLNSDAGEYTLNLTAIAHYRDYGHVINAVKKRVTVEVV